MVAAIGALSLFSLLGHVLLLALLVAQRHRLRIPPVWAVLPLVTALAIVLPLLANRIASDGIGLALVLTFAATSYIASFGAAMLRDVTHKKGRLWLLAMLLWLAALVLATAAGPSAALGQAGWLRNPFSTSSAVPLVTVGGFVLVSALLLATTARAYLRARLPEAANRTLLWFTAGALALMSAIFLMSGNALLQLPGILLLSGVNGFYTYLQLAVRPVDVRTQMRGIGRSVVLVVIGTLIIFGTVAITDFISPEFENAVAAVFILSAGASVAFAIVELGVRALAAQVTGAQYGNFADAVDQWSRALANVDSLHALSTTVETGLRAAFQCTSARLLWAEVLADEGVVDLQTGIGRDKTRIATLSLNSANYQQWTTERQAFTQHELSELRDTKLQADAVSSALATLEQQAFAPVVAESRLLGLLGAGPKADEMPYTADDLRLLATFAQVTAVALCRVIDAGTVAALRNERDQAQAQIAALEAVKTDFVAIASHELRTPLTQVQGNVELLDALNAAAALEPAQAADIIGSMRAATERLDTLVTAMLDVSQIDVDALQLACEPVDIEHVVCATADPLMNAIRQRRISVAIHDLRGLPPIRADRGRLEQALRAVLLNAIKFTPDNGSIDISATHEPAQRTGQPDTILLAVRDSGTGIAPENLELIFHKFFRAHTPETHSSGDIKFMGAGPGLGLTIARGIVEAHGGTIWAESSGYGPDACAGTTVFVRLPVAAG